eukprot:TRINITY_DN8175_c0_g1_i1.p1 TRINITY_DN8175_c0_g1~~TRINITY_DN8175_c0_g1_i1.p1  ORF type:complete len:747 (+),score=177.35 TRINITY_DN8175_c0_g1_i1:52-2292(+)
MSKRKNQKKKKPMNHHVYGSAIQFEDEKKDLWLTRKEKEEKYKNQYKPQHLQEVRDDKGRRRFHGAFTGGFSAGHFNTVGSEEGWTPSTFKSQRGKKDVVVQRPEDFMDDEDREALGLGSDIVAKSHFHSSANSMVIDAPKNSIIPGFAPSEIFVQKNDTIGTKLLNKLGWREGQGIGKKKSKKIRDHENVVRTYKVAPKDTDVISYQFKDNQHGVGYNPRFDSPEFALIQKRTVKHTSRLNMSDILEQRTGGITNFGYGALEEADEHVDIYGGTNMEDYDRDLDVGIKKKEKKSSVPESRPNPRRKSIPEFAADGSRLVPGFSKARNVYEETVFPPIEVPKNFKPKRDWKGIPGPGEPKPYELLQHKMMISQTFEVMSANQRGKLLGEKELPETEHRRPSLDNKGATILGAVKQEPEKEDAFPDNPEKNQRYKTWLKIQKGLIPHNTKWYDGLTYKQTVAENDEFKTVWGRFKPLSGILGERFQSATISSNEKTEKPVLEKVEVKRFVKDWSPANLLCKRFNIKNPQSNTTDTMTSQIKEMKKFMKIDDSEEDPFTAPKEQENSLDEPVPAPIVLESIQDPDEEIQDIEKPGMDIFQSIFGSSDSDDSEEMLPINPIPHATVKRISVKDENSDEEKMEIVETRPSVRPRVSTPEPAPPIRENYSEGRKESSKDTYFEKLKQQAKERSKIKAETFITVLDLPLEEESRESRSKRREESSRKRKRSRDKDKRHKHKHKHRHKRRRKD